MLDIVCFKWGDLYGPEYVNKLFRGITRNTTVPFRFTCFTEDPEGVECPTKPFLKPLPHWWYIIGLFNPAHNFGSKVLYLDLDTIITDNIDDMLTVDEPFVILRDFYRPQGLQTAYIMWEPAWGAFVWEKLNTLYPEGKYGHLLKYPGGTNRWIETTVGLDVPRLQDLFPDQCLSYKVHIQSKKEHKYKLGKMVFFHGLPRPHEVASLPWMIEHWK